MTTEFLFVDNSTQNDRATRRQMRQHVMKGKNAGRKISRPSKLSIAPRGQSIWYPGAVDERFGNAFEMVGLPVKVHPQGLRVINEFFTYTADHMYQAQMGLAMDDAKFMWLRLFFGDMGALGCNLAMMEAANETFLRRRRDSPRALLCLARTFACMQKRLHSSDALSDSTLTIVVSLISQQQMLSDIPGAKIHIEGLRQMIELRGGIDQLEDNPPLLMKICKMDIVFALEYGGSTAFFRDRLSEVRQNLSRQGFELDLEAAASMVQHTPVKSELYDVLLDALSLGFLFNQDLEAGSIGVHSFQEILVSICFRLLRIRPLDEPRLESPLDSEYHIGLVLFIITIFLQYDNRRVLDCTLVLDCLKDTLIGPLENGQPELRLWLMVMGGIWTSGDSEIASWMFPLALDTASRLGLETWMDVRTSINAYPWVNRLHDRSGEELWKQITSHL